MEFEIKNTDRPQMGKIYRFFCWCSGARLYILKKCPTDYNVFFGIGMIVLLTGTMAVFSGGYAFYTIFRDPWLALFFGLFWGVIIFFIDWYLVSSLKKENKFGRELLTATPRLILALFLAFVISRPLELKLFESEINTQLASINQLKANDFKENVNQSFAEIKELEEQNKTYQQKLDQLLQKRNELFNLVIEEAEGRSPVQKAGKGSVYREKKAAYDLMAADYNEESARLIPLISANNRRINELKALRDVAIESGKKVVKQTDGFLARIEAYNALGQSNSIIRFTSLFILALFICIEVGPMFVKLISKRGVYDEVLELEEIRLTAGGRQEMVQIREKTSRIIEVEKEKNKTRLQEELANQNDFTRWALEAQSEIGREKISRWKQRELAKLDDNLDDYRPSIDELIEEAKSMLRPN
jgi:hypothetical protein